MSELDNNNSQVTPTPTFCACLGQLNTAPWQPSMTPFASPDQLLKENKVPDLIVLAASAPEQDDWLVALRQAPKTAQCLIFTQTESPLSAHLANGLWQEAYLVQWQTTVQRAAQVKLAFEDETAYKLLSYLWVHNITLTPQAQPHQPFLYHYPLLSAWGIAPQDSFNWLMGLKQRHWIENEKLHNRLRYCPTCHSGHLNYIDVCPQCQSIDIQTQSSLHCFSCGHVGKQQTFRKQASLSCPNCFQQLRHIGVDYDRPLENQHCNSCDLLFTDALVHAECLDCKSHSDVNDLHVQSVHSFKLAVAGRNLVRQGRTASIFHLAPGEQMPLSQFYWLIDWQNKLAKRHKQTHTILSVQLLNLPSFLARMGEAKGLAQLDALQERLRNVLRTTDACSNYSQDGLLLFLPLTDQEHITPVLKKLVELKQKQEDLTLEIAIKTVTIPADIGDNVADWLTDALVQARPLA